jgi:hypothetical protein
MPQMTQMVQIIPENMMEDIISLDFVTMKDSILLVTFMMMVLVIVIV